MSALQDILSGGKKSHKGVGVSISLSSAGSSSMDSVAEAMKTICPKVDPEEAAAAFRRAFEACMLERDEEGAEEESEEE